MRSRGGRSRAPLRRLDGNEAPRRAVAGGGRRAWRWAVAGGLLLFCGCRGDDGRVLRVAERVALADASAATLTIDPTGRHWLGASGRIARGAEAGTEMVIPLPGSDVPRVVGWIGGAAYMVAGDSLYRIVAEGASVTARRGELGENPIEADVRGRFLVQGARSGAVVLHDPATLEPRLAWAARGAPTTALAASPLGDRIYQALGGGEERSRVLIRDLQTGRVLATVEFASAFLDLAMDRAGVLYGVAREGRRAVVVALRPEGEGLTLLWRRALPLSRGWTDPGLVLGEGRLAVTGLGGGARLLEEAGGRVIGRTREEPLDVAFGGGGFWALFPGELRRLE